MRAECLFRTLITDEGSLHVYEVCAWGRCVQSAYSEFMTLKDHCMCMKCVHGDVCGSVGL